VLGNLSSFDYISRVPIDKDSRANNGVNFNQNNSATGISDQEIEFLRVFYQYPE